MPKYERKRRQKQEEVDRKERARQKESEPTLGQINGIGQDVLMVGETPFQPPMGSHAELLAKTRSNIQRANLVLNLQRTYGNAYVQRLLESHTVQAKLTVNPPGDRYEQEAERVSEEVTRNINSLVNRQPEEEEEEGQTGSFLQRQPEEEEEEETQTISSLQRQSATFADNLETRIERKRGNGQPLSDVVRGSMEQAFGADFSSVKVHTDAEADTLNRELNARAFTTGQDIFFRQGEYSPGSGGGQKLIAHELTHVVQQTSNRQLKRKVSKKKATIANGKVTFGSGRKQRLFASDQQIESSNPFTSQLSITRVASANSHIFPFIQRYKTNSSDNKVKFESTSFNAVGNGPLDLSNKNATWFQAKSNVYSATGDVKATGGWSLIEGKWTQDAKQAPNDVKDWKVGMLQTAYLMSRYGYYPDPAQNYKRNGGSVPAPPVRDAFVGSPYPWYDGNRTNYPTCWQDFGAAAESTKSVRMGDQPATCDMPWFKGPGTKQPISSLAGTDMFVTHLAVYNKSKNEIIYLNNAIWAVYFSSMITVDSKNPVNSTFKGGRTAVISVNEGTGLPSVTSGTVANAELSKTERTWETY